MHVLRVDSTLGADSGPWSPKLGTGTRPRRAVSPLTCPARSRALEGTLAEPTTMARRAHADPESGRGTGRLRLRVRASWGWAKAPPPVDHHTLIPIGPVSVSPIGGRPSAVFNLKLGYSHWQLRLF